MISLRSRSELLLQPQPLLAVAAIVMAARKRLLAETAAAQVLRRVAAARARRLVAVPQPGEIRRLLGAVPPREARRLAAQAEPPSSRWFAARIGYKPRKMQLPRWVGCPDLSGKTVMLRVSAIDSNSADTTSPDVIHGVILAVQAASKGTAPTIIVGEDGFATNGNTLGAMQTLGITAVCTATGATPMDLSKQTYTTRTNANAASYPNGVSFSDPVYTADYVISVPVCKTHSQGGYTMALKLWYGNVPTAGRLHPSAASFNAPPELHLIRKADFVVLDATHALISGGPQVAAGNTNVAQPKIVVASKDAVAADVTGLWILKYNGSTVIASNAEAWTKFGQITRALKLASLGWLTASTQFPYVSQGVTEATTIMGY